MIQVAAGTLNFPLSAKARATRVVIPHTMGCDRNFSM